MGKSMSSEIRERLKAGLQAGDVFTVTRTFTEEDTWAFGEVSRDHNPVHYQKNYAKNLNLQDRICHGLLVGSMVTEIGGQLGCLATEMKFKFIQPVYFGDTIECNFTIMSIEDNYTANAFAEFFNQRGEKVLECEISGILPNQKGIELMKWGG